MKPIYLDIRFWAVLLTLGLAASLGISLAQKDAAVTRAEALAERVQSLDKNIVDLTAERNQALAHATASDARLTDFAAQTAAIHAEQAEASARMAAELSDVNRRLRAAQQEISRAPSGLGLDDPLPRSLRDSLACARGDTGACASSRPEAHPGVLPDGASEPATPPAAYAGDAQRA